MVTSQLNALKTRKGGAKEVNQWVQMVVKIQINNINSAETEEFKQFRVWRESQGKDGYNPPWST